MNKKHSVNLADPALAVAVHLAELATAVTVKKNNISGPFDLLD